MPAPLAVNREAVKAHAITHGVREAARAFNLPESTVKSWSTREDWLGPAMRPIVRPLPASIAPRASGASTPSQAALSTLERLGSKSKLKVARWGVHATTHAARLKGEEALAASTSMQACTRTLANAQLPGWVQSTDAASVHLHLHRGTGPDDVPAKVIDV